MTHRDTVEPREAANDTWLARIDEVAAGPSRGRYLEDRMAPGKPLLATAVTSGTRRAPTNRRAQYVAV